MQNSGAEKNNTKLHHSDMSIVGSILPFFVRCDIFQEVLNVFVIAHFWIILFEILNRFVVRHDIAYNLKENWLNDVIDETMTE